MRIPSSSRLPLIAATTSLSIVFASWSEHSPPGSEPAAERHDPGRDPGRVRFGRDIRPILADRCFTCHGPDEGQREADLRLDSFAEATRDLDGAFAVVPGEPDASLMVERILAEDESDVMPPPSSGKPPLTEDEKALLVRWIEQGAEYEPHWAFVPPQRTEVSLGADDRDPIDTFVKERLRAEGFELSPAAEHVDWLRRVFLDLTGLPPTPAEVEAFRADDSEQAFERQVDLLLRTEPYRSRVAERLATPWLDLARYADTSGIHMDAGRQAWVYRDWILTALRDRMPFDQFTVEQLAGDLLPDATTAQRIASGFHRQHITSDEGGAISEEYLLEYAIDRTETTGAVWLGLTVGCARCHDHKFDPVDQDDFYGMLSFFDNVDQPGIYSQSPDPNRAFEPSIQVFSDEDQARIDELDEEIRLAEVALDDVSEDELRALRGEVARLREPLERTWRSPRVAEAKSLIDEGVRFDEQDDGSLLVSGANPQSDAHQVELIVPAGRYDLLQVELMTDPSLPSDGPGRAQNGNAILSGLEVESIDALGRENGALGWAAAFGDHNQSNDDFAPLHALDPGNGRMWAADAHRVEGPRVLWFQLAEPVESGGATRLVVTLHYKSPYAQHSFGRLRFRVGQSDEELRRALPIARSRVQFGSQHENSDSAANYELGPDAASGFAFDRSYVGGEIFGLPSGQYAKWIRMQLGVPTARRSRLSIGSDDGVQAYLNGELVFENRVNRGAAPDQDAFDLDLESGVHELLFKIVNTGGPGGFFHRVEPDQESWPESALPLLYSDDVLSAVSEEQALHALRSRRSEQYRNAVAALEQLRADRKAYVDALPRAMVMSERMEPRTTYVRMRGQYDQPDESRPAVRRVPKILGEPANWPENATRLDFARWLVGADNPLTARVLVNRLWESVFGRGLVATSEDFGLQGSWPSHPELLDTLAVDLREGGWDLHGLLRRIVLTDTYRQSSRRRAELAEVDPENALLGYFPRQRLSAEQIRDQALYVSGLLVEQFGGPSVKPYQPGGLWREVAMLNSNTRFFEPDEGDALYRRSLYTYWKRASPPPSMLTFDAPTREFCVVRRDRTNTPLQALVLWNDVQFVEAANYLALRLHVESPDLDEDERIDDLWRRIAGKSPTPKRAAAIRAVLERFRDRFAGDPDSASKLLAVGESAMRLEAMRSELGLDSSELAAWATVASAVLASDTVLTKD
ncbi:MAG: PSD1 and planctomycete cytochrome C domain-containing protein [Planctomycetota bacterium]